MPENPPDGPGQQKHSLELQPASSPPCSADSHYRKPSCGLESLHKDALTAIMAAAQTTPDLSSFIRASPIFYYCFLASKRFILLSLASRALGPALRETVILAQTERLDWYNEDYYDKVASTVSLYAQRLAQDHLRTWGVDTATAVRVLQLSRTTHFFVDLYSSARLRVLHDLDPLSATPLSQDERTRLSLALTRFQILTHLYPQWNTPGDPAKNETLVFDKFFSLFLPWELEQISEVNGATLNACKALMQYEAYPPRARYTTMRQRRAEYFDKFYWNLEAFYDKIMTVSAGDGDFLERMCASLSEERNRNMGGGLVRALDGSHIYRHHLTQAPPTREELCGPRDIETPGGKRADSPYAWTDALEGRDWPVWGLDLLQDPPPPADRTADDGEVGKLERWRWMGFVFWDEGRVELAKRTATFSGYQTGWLVKLRASGS